MILNIKGVRLINPNPISATYIQMLVFDDFWEIYKVHVIVCINIGYTYTISCITEFEHTYIQSCPPPPYVGGGGVS